MNYFRLYIGDFQRDTQHLGPTETGVYFMLLMSQYGNEKALPADPELLCRICRAHTAEECAAVRSVADEFFPVVDGTRWNPRAVRELAAGVEAIEKMRAAGRLGAERRWGGDGEPQPTIDGAPDGEPNRVAIHPPTTNHQPPTFNHQNPKNTVGPAPDAVPPVSKKAELTAAAQRVLAFLNEKTGARYQPVEGNLEMMRARLREGFTEADLRGVVAKKCRDWSGDDTMAKYLRPATLFNRTKFAQYHGEKR